MQSAVKVGGLVVVFGVLILGAYAMLEKSIFAKPADKYVAEFPDAGGVTSGSAVLMAGVKIGVVDKIELVQPRLARVTLALDKGVRIPSGSVVVVPASFIAIGDTRLIVQTPLTDNPPLEPGATLPGKLGSPLDSFAPQGEKTLEEINKTLVALQGLLSDRGLKKQLSDLMATVTQTTKQFGGVAGRLDSLIASNSGRFTALLDTTSGMLKNMQAVSVEVRKMVASGELQGKTTALLDNLNSAVIQGKGLVTDLQAFVNDPELRSSLKGTMENVKIMSDSGTKIAANAETLSSKGIEIADETKALMQKANKLAEQVDELIQKFNKTVDKIGGQGKSTLQAVKFEATLSQQTKPNTLRADANIFVPIGKDQLMFGLYDAFESNKLNLQLKKQFGANLGLRYGAYASKPGIGVDYRVAPRVSMRGDLFGLNDPRFDARLGYDFGRDTTGWVGLDKIFERNSLSIGVTVRK